MEKKYPRVGVGAMIQDSEGKVLLGLYIKTNEWRFPGGHVEFGETLLEAVIRETKEETGLNIDKLELISVADEMGQLKSHYKHYINIGFKASLSSGELATMEMDKFEKWQWFSLDELPEKIFEGTKLVLQNFKDNKMYQNEKRIN